MRKKIFIFILVIWMIVIFLFSNNNSNYSNALSKRIIDMGISLIDIIPGVSIDEDLKMIIIDIFNPVVRKLAHFLEYFILSLLVFNLLKLFHLGKIKYILTIGICFIYSVIDEFHQTFIDGRTGRFTDCLIDTGGCILFLIIVVKLTKKYKSKKN